MSNLKSKAMQIFAALAALCSALPVQANDYPDRVVRLVVAYPPGGATDSAVRVVAERLQKLWGKTVVVENKPGASGRVAMAQVAKAPADGRTFVAVINSTISDELLQAGEVGALSASRELVPVSTLCTTPAVLAVNKAFGVETLAQYIALAKAKPGAVSFGSTGNATSGHFFGELLKRQAGIEITHVPFPGEGPNVGNLLGGHVSSSFISASGAKKIEATGKVTLIAISNRSSLLPNVPSFAELGVKGIDRDSWIGFLAPKETPQAAIDSFAADLRQVLAQADVRERFVGLGVLAMGSTPQEFEQRIQADKAYWAEAIKTTGIKLN